MYCRGGRCGFQVDIKCYSKQRRRCVHHALRYTIQQGLSPYIGIIARVDVWNPTHTKQEPRPPCGCFPIQLISRNHLAQGPFCAYHCIINDRVKQKNLCRPLTGLSTRQSTRDNPSSNHPHWHIGLSQKGHTRICVCVLVIFVSQAGEKDGLCQGKVLPLVCMLCA